MKGKIITTVPSTVSVGEKVLTLTKQIVRTIASVQDNKVTFVGLPTTLMPIKHLFTLNVEFEERSDNPEQIPGLDVWETHTIPLHESEYQKVIDSKLVDSNIEIEFRKTTVYIEPSPNIHSNRGYDKEVAVLRLHPSGHNIHEKIYARDEVAELIRQAYVDGYENGYVRGKWNVDNYIEEKLK